jgi:hypothetical protein
MKKSLKNETGFALVETLLIILILAVIGFGGYYVWHTQHANKTPAATTTSVTQNKTKPAPAISPYAGWATATLQYEKISYKYPAGWTVKDLSYASPKGQGCVYPGDDYIILTSPHNEQVVLHTGVDCIGDAGATAFDAEPVSALGQNLYLVLENNAGFGTPAPTTPNFACLAQTKSPDTPLDFKSKNITFDGDGSSQPANSFCYYPYAESSIQSASDIPSETIDSIKNSADFNTAKLIFESMHY